MDKGKVIEIREFPTPDEQEKRKIAVPEYPKKVEKPVELPQPLK